MLIKYSSYCIVKENKHHSSLERSGNILHTSTTAAGAILFRIPTHHTFFTADYHTSFRDKTHFLRRTTKNASLGDKIKETKQDR